MSSVPQNASDDLYYIRKSNLTTAPQRTPIQALAHRITMPTALRFAQYEIAQQRFKGTSHLQL